MIDVPLKEFDNREHKFYVWLKKRPICCECGEHISDEYGYKIDNNWYCKICIDYLFKHRIEAH